MVGAAPKRCIWIKTSLFSGGAAGYPTAQPRMVALLNFIRHLCGPAPIGVITHKRLHDQAQEWAGMPEAAEWGYYGRDDRGTNRFQEAKVWACVGDPIPNLGAVQAECRLSGEGWEAVARGRCHATAIQSLARARHIRRDDDPPILIYAGKYPPPGHEWEEHQIPKVQRKSGLRDLLEDVADDLGLLPPPRWFMTHAVELGERAEIDLTTISESTLKRNIAKVALSKKWTQQWRAEARGICYGHPEAVDGWIGKGCPLPFV